MKKGQTGLRCPPELLRRFLLDCGETEIRFRFRGREHLLEAYFAGEEGGVLALRYRLDGGWEYPSLAAFWREARLEGEPLARLGEELTLLQVGQERPTAYALFREHAARLAGKSVRGKQNPPVTWAWLYRARVWECLWGFFLAGFATAVLAALVMVFHPDGLGIRGTLRWFPLIWGGCTGIMLVIGGIIAGSRARQLGWFRRQERLLGVSLEEDLAGIAYPEGRDHLCAGGWFVSLCPLLVLHRNYIKSLAPIRQETRRAIDEDDEDERLGVLTLRTADGRTLTRRAGGEYLVTLKALEAWADQWGLVEK